MVGRDAVAKFGQNTSSTDALDAGHLPGHALEIRRMPYIGRLSVPLKQA